MQRKKIFKTFKIILNNIVEVDVELNDKEIEQFLDSALIIIKQDAFSFI